MERQELSETVFTRTNRRLNEFYIRFMITMHRLKLLVLDCIQKIVDKVKPIVVPSMHLLDAAIYVVCQILHGLNHNQYYVYIRGHMIRWCPDFLLGFKDSMAFYLRLTLTAMYLILTEIFQHKVLPASGKEVVEQCQKSFNTIKNVNITRHTPLILFNTEEIETIKQAEEHAHRLQKNSNITQAVGSSVGIFAGVLTLGGFVLAPFTLGASVGLTAVGIGLGVSSTAVSIGATAVNIKGKKRVRRNVDVIFLKYFKLMKSMGQLVTQYVRLTQSLDKLASVKWSDLSESMGEKLQRLGHLRQKIGRLEVSFQTLPEKVEELLQCMNILSNLVKEVTEEMHNHPDHRDVRITDDVDLPLKDAFETIVVYHHEKPTPMSDFTLGMFGYNNDYPGMPADRIEKEKCPSGSFSHAPFIPAKCIVIIETVDIALELADDLFLSAAKSLKVISKLGIVIGAIGIFLDVGILTKALIDLSKGSKDKLSVRFRTWRLHMMLINELLLKQRQKEEIQFFLIFFHPVSVFVMILITYIVLQYTSLLQ